MIPLAAAMLVCVVVWSVKCVMVREETARCSVWTRQSDRLTSMMTTCLQFVTTNTYNYYSTDTDRPHHLSSISVSVTTI